MKAVRLHPDGLKLEQIARPEPRPDDVLVRVIAAAITRDELTWPTDRLPAIPSYELCGVVEPDGAQLAALPELHPQVDSVFPLEQFDAAFARTAERGKTGKVVLRVADA